MPLSQMDLISKAAGLLALGYASWSHFPQLLTVWAEKPKRGGLSWALLGIWIFADTLALFGLYFGGALQTQIFQTAWYLVGDVLVTTQQAFYHGYLPFTARRRQRKADEHGASRAVVLSQNMTSDSPWYTNNREKLDAKRQKDAAKQAKKDKKASKKAPATSQPMHSMSKRSGRRGYVELLPAKSHPRHDHSSDESEEELRRKEAAGPGKIELTVIHLFGKWNAITQPICLVVLCCIMILIWYLTAYRPRDSLAAIEHASPPSATAPALAAFILGSLGTVLYNAPRCHQLYITITEKSTEGIEPYMFIALMGENVGTLVSILVVSREGSYLFAEAPYLAGIFLALSFDATFIAFHLKFSGNPITSSVERAWSSPLYVVEHQLLEAPSPKTDARHRKALTRLRREHLQDSDRFMEASPRLTADARRKARQDLQHQRDALESASHHLDHHIESSGDEARIAAHDKSSRAHQHDLDAIHHAASRRDLDALDQAHQEWNHWSPDAGAPLRSASQRSRGSSVSTMTRRGW
ncbi:hypothetical protein BCR35DRAFT_308835 [Leucosporidium creatinivorum]|uniref:PQ loop repeat-domain-containing protein n=1 Tax=Leucosporidium creatinivorum TaxID=106004 RepID=A0A1Y2DWN7_9BASI|nr:hypothetical protein BCR35DRAFT_308835 [Leucosporidium creatinivorum]